MSKLRSGSNRRAEGDSGSADLRLELETLRRENTRLEKAERERHKLQAELVEIARRVGLEELTTNILHNVGNTLNSVNVALSKIESQILASKISSIPQLATLISEHRDHLADFIANDPRGKKVPEYIALLGDILGREKVEIESEIQVMRKSVDHISQIVSYQQAYSRMVEFKESLAVDDVICDAIDITRGDLDGFGIQVLTEFGDLPRVRLDRRKLIQILLNLISNAKHSLVDRGAEDKRIWVRAHVIDDDMLRLEVEDNGVGIDPSVMDQIFTFGFTTREEGHGFGLHGCANHAAEMDGNFYARSDGKDQGARFVLELPIAPQD